MLPNSFVKPKFTHDFHIFTVSDREIGVFMNMQVLIKDTLAKGRGVVKMMMMMMMIIIIVIKQHD